MALFDDILGQVRGHPEILNLATKVGIEPQQAEAAVAALGEAHQQPGDTVQQAADRTGLDTGTISQIIDHIGGEGSLVAGARRRSRSARGERGERGDGDDDEPSHPTSSFRRAVERWYT